MVSDPSMQLQIIFKYGMNSRAVFLVHALRVGTNSSGTEVSPCSADREQHCTASVLLRQKFTEIPTRTAMLSMLSSKEPPAAPDRAVAPRRRMLLALTIWR